MITPKQGNATGEQDRDHLHTENNLTSGLTMSHKIRNSSLQPYKNKILTEEDRKNKKFGAIIQGKSFKGHSAKKDDELSLLYQ